MIMDGYYGQIMLFPTNWIPEKWYPCDGRSLVVNDHPALAVVLGYGQDDEYFRKNEQGPEVCPEFDPEKLVERKGRRSYDPKGLALGTHGGKHKTDSHRRQDKSCQPHIQERQDVLKIEGLDRCFFNR